MITPAYCATMARYNLWQNRSLIAAARTLPPEAVEAGRGAFFGSIRATFSHLMWADLMWMGRFEGTALPPGGIAGSTALFPDWDAVCGARVALDARILDWATAVAPSMLEGDLVWYSGILGREVSRPAALLVAHMFNHQTHHRGQIHAMLTAAGAVPGMTDLGFMPETLD